jgi:hypothetical protein
MLILLDELIREILMRGVLSLQPAGGGAVESGQVGFEPPDDDWRKHVSSLQRNALNVYLVDLRENRKLYSNERERNIDNGVVYESPAPIRLDCHYLISAWTTGSYSSGSLQPAIEPTRDEHRLIYETAVILTRHQSFNPLKIYPADSMALKAWPASLRDAELPVSLMPPEGFPKLAEFWGTMGQKHPWKQVLYLIVTIPVEMTREISGPIVTTRITEFRKSGVSSDGDMFIEIGGYVAAGSPPNPVAEAWVAI